MADVVAKLWFTEPSWRQFQKARGQSVDAAETAVEDADGSYDPWTGKTRVHEKRLLPYWTTDNQPGSKAERLGSYAQFVASFNKVVDKLAESGVIVRKVFADVPAMIAWGDENGVDLDEAGRGKFLEATVGGRWRSVRKIKKRAQRAGVEPPSGMLTCWSNGDNARWGGR